MAATDTSTDVIPPSEAIRRRLARALTEADLLRKQLKVSELAEREADRLRRLLESREAPA